MAGSLPRAPLSAASVTTGSSACFCSSEAIAVSFCPVGMAPSDAATCSRTCQSGSSISFRTASCTGLLASPSHRSARRTADVRTSRDASVNALVTVAMSMLSMPSRTQSAFTRVRAGAVLAASALSSGTTFTPLRSTSRRWAVSRHQPFGWDSASTSCAGVARESCGRVVSRCTPSCTMR